MFQVWRDFYTVAATISATLVGLLFVGLSLHLRIVVAHAEVRSLARVTLANFGLVLVVSLFFLIPDGQSALSVQLIIAGAVSIVIAAPSLVATLRTRRRTLEARLLVLRFGLSVLTYGAVILAGVLLGAGSTNSALSALVSVTFVLLLISLRNSWDLLVTVGAATHSGEHPSVSPGRDPEAPRDRAHPHDEAQPYRQLWR